MWGTGSTISGCTTGSTSCSGTTSGIGGSRMFGSRHRRSVRPRALSLGLLAGLAALMLGGCVVDRESDPGQTNQIGEEVREFDLTQPPSRQEVGLPEGKSQVTYQLPDRQPFP